MTRPCAPIGNDKPTVAAAAGVGSNLKGTLLTSLVRLGWLRRTWTAFQRGLLGKSSRDYMKRFTGSDEYFDEAIAAQRGWPQQQPAQPLAEPEYEPVHGWSKRQLADYLARNPAYRPTYVAELRKHQHE